LFELRNRAAQFLGGLLIESAGQTYVTNSGSHHEHIPHRRERHFITSDLYSQRAGRAGALNGDADPGAALAAHVFQRVRLQPVLGGMAVTRDDRVAITQPRALGGHSLTDADHIKPPVPLIHRHADAVKMAALFILHLAEFAPAVEARMRVE